METFFSFIYDLLFGPPLMQDVVLALGPLAALAIAAGSQAIGQGLSHVLNTGERRRQRRRAKREETLRNETLEDLQESVAQTRDASEEATRLAGLTDAELFGDERQRRISDVRDAIAGQSAGARTAISRALLAGGGDVTGAGGVTLSRLQETANSSLGRALAAIENDIAQRGDAYRRFQTSRGDNLRSSALAAENNIFASLTGSAANAEQMRILQRQAQGQMGADVGSSIASFTSQVI